MRREGGGRDGVEKYLCCDYGCVILIIASAFMPISLVAEKMFWSKCLKADKPPHLDQAKNRAVCRCCTRQPSNLRAWQPHTHTHTHTHTERERERERENKFHLTSFCFLSRIPGKCPVRRLCLRLIEMAARAQKRVSLSSTSV